MRRITPPPKLWRYLVYIVIAFFVLYFLQTGLKYAVYERPFVCPEDIEVDDRCKPAKDQVFIVGMGTGKSGTHALADLLSAQRNATMSHEQGGCRWFPWEYEKYGKGKTRTQLFNAHYKRIFAKTGMNRYHYYGDVAMYWLPYVETVMSKFPHTKFIATRRSREKTIASWVTWKPYMHRWVDDPEALGYKANPSLDPCYPKLGHCKSNRGDCEIL